MNYGESYIGARVGCPGRDNLLEAPATGTVVGFGAGIAPTGLNLDGMVLVEWDGGTTAYEYPSDLRIGGAS